MTRPVATGLVAALLAVAAVVFLAGPGVLTGEALLGYGTSDIWSHAWSYGWVASALGHGQLPLLGAPVGFPAGATWVLVDAPTAVLVAPLAALGGPGLAYDAAVILQLALAAGCMAWWARLQGVRPGLAVVAGLLVALSPFARGVVASGVPEVLAFGVIPVLVESTRRALEGRRRWLVVACLAALWISGHGAYGVLAAALPCALVVGIEVARRRWGRAVRAVPIALCGALPLGLVVFAMRHWDHPVLHLESRPFREPVDPALWAWAPLRGADLLNFALPARWLPEPATWTLHHHTTYLGLILVAVAVVAAIRLPRARWLLAMAAVALVAALGPMLQVGGVARLPLPGSLLDLVGLHHAYRLTGLAVLCLVGAAALLAEASWERRRGWVAAVAVLAAAEGLALAPVRGVLPTTADPSGPVELALSQGEGAVLDLPFDRIGRHPQGPWPQRTFYLQAVHGLPVASVPYGAPPALEGSPTLEAIDDLVVQAWMATPGYSMPATPGLEPMDRPHRRYDALRAPPADRLVQDRQRLAEQGFTWVTVDRAALPPSAREQLEPLLRQWLGEPALDVGERALWRVEGAPQ